MNRIEPAVHFFDHKALGCEVYYIHVSRTWDNSMPKKFCFIFAFVLLRCATSQDCALPDTTTIDNGLLSLLVSVGGEGSSLSTTLLDHRFTCLAVGSSRDQYRQVSVAVRYTKSTESGVFTAQFPLRCESGNFDTTGELDQSPPANVFNISTRRDCFVCTTVAMQPGFTIDTTADCACKYTTTPAFQCLF